MQFPPGGDEFALGCAIRVDMPYLGHQVELVVILAFERAQDEQRSGPADEAHERAHDLASAVGSIIPIVGGSMIQSRAL